VTEFWMNFHFIRPGWLWLAPITVGLWWLWQRRTEPLRGWRQQVEPELLDAMVIGRDPQGDWARYALPAAWVLGVITIAGPTWKVEPNPFAADAQPLVILLKADKSMQPVGVSPTPLERAQLKIADLVRVRKGQPLGLYAYAGSAHLVLPPTRDAEIVAQMAAEISPEIMPTPGDRLDLAIEKATKLLIDEEEGGSLLVIADSVMGDPQSRIAKNPETARLPIQFLALSNPDSAEIKTLQDAADRLGAPVRELTVDDQDLTAISEFAERRATTGIAGESSRWQEAGYWLTSALALLVALSFRRRELTAGEEQ